MDGILGGGSNLSLQDLQAAHRQLTDQDLDRLQLITKLQHLDAVCRVGLPQQSHVDLVRGSKLLELLHLHELGLALADDLVLMAQLDNQLRLSVCLCGVDACLDMSDLLCRACDEELVDRPEELLVLRACY